jgi:integrase
MPRFSIDKASVRNKLPARKEPYWGAPVERGLFVGFRQTEAGWGSWIARFHDEDRRHRYNSLGPVSAENDYEAAKSAARRWSKSLAAGVNTNDVTTIANACKEYVKDRKNVKGKATARDAEARFEREVDNHAIAKLPLDRVRQKRLEEWRDDLVTRKKRPLSKAAANRTLTALKAALNHAVRHRYVSAERTIEWALVKPFSDANKRRDLYLDLKQRRALLEAATGAVRDLLEAAMLTGARAGELTSAKRSQFDGRTNTLTLTGKTGTRKVPLSPVASALFARLAENKLPAAWLLTRDDGREWRHSDWDELVREAAMKAELPAGTCVYTLRHSHITEAITSGMSPLEVARLVGTSLAMIDKHYGHLANTTARERLAKVVFV